MIERCHPIMEIILLDSFLDGIERHGEKFLNLLQKDLNFEQKGKIVDLIGFEIIENALLYIEDPENIIIDETSFDFCLSKLLLSEVLTELASSVIKNAGLRQKHFFKWGGTLKRQAAKTDKAATSQIASGRNRLFGQGKGTVSDSFRAAGTYAKAGGYGRAVGQLAGGAYNAARATAGLAVGGARKLLAKTVSARGRRLQSLPFKQYKQQQKIQKAKEEIEARRQRYANVPGV